MDLAMGRNRTFLEVMEGLFPKKGENVYYEEEGPISKVKKGDYSPVISNMIDELNKIKNEADVLTIIDPYFLSGVEETDSDSNDDCIERLRCIFEEVRFNKIQIYTEENNINPEFCSQFTETFEGNGITKVYVRCNLRNVHDRFWITNQNTGIVMGTSFNGLGKKLSVIYQLQEKELRELLAELDRLGIQYNSWD